MENLHKEIDHRIKNNLNMISSILGLQILGLKDNINESSEEILKKSKLRIDALVLIHNALTKSDKAHKIDFKSYVESLVEQINDTFTKELEVKIDAYKINCSLERMIELGIILNELLINSIKFTNQNIEINLLKIKHHYVLEYLEKGNTTADVHKIKGSKKLGIKLIKLMVKQMDADMDIKLNGDLGYIIRFPHNSK
jgi:two-component sensor histidine kinase